MDTSDCFFCGKPINGDFSREHIFSDKFLEFFDLKTEKLSSSLPRSTSYSKVKIPSHASCNNGVGSEHEAYTLRLIKSMDANADHLSKIQMDFGSGLNEALRQTVGQWIAKLYYGLIYWEAGLKSHTDLTYQLWLKSLLEDSEFVFLRKCFTEQIAFKIPTSIFYFHVPEHADPVFRFDFSNGLPNRLFYIRIRAHLFIAAIADANLVHQWLTYDHVQSLQSRVTQASLQDPVAYLHAVAHVWAVRELLPVAPRLEYQEGAILDRSREGMMQAPGIDSGAVNKRASELFVELAARWKSKQA